MNLNVNGILPADIHDDLDRLPTPNPMSLIGEISRIMNGRFLEGEEKNSLFQKSSRLLMMVLSRKEGVTQLDLVKATHLKAPTISVTLQKLEKDGYVERKHDDYDLRAVRVYLTEKGKTYNRYMIRRIISEEDTALECLTDSEYKQLMRLLMKLRENLIDDSEKNKY